MKKKISVLKETSSNETRVVLCPSEVPIFLDTGYEVLVETNAGIGIGFEDSVYEKAGAKIVSCENAWKQSKFILKYKPPTSEEYTYLHEDMHLGAIFHAEGNPTLIRAMLKSRMTAYSYEFFETSDKTFPLAIVGGEIAGKMAVIYAAYHLQIQRGGSGTLLSNSLETKPPKVLVIGYGNVGSAVAKMTSDMGADVLVLGTNAKKLRQFQLIMGNNVQTALCTPEVLKKELPQTDAVFGAILISTFDTSPIITTDMVKTMKPGSIIVDVTSGYGSGYLETFDRNTTLAEPVFERFDVLHCKIDNLPSAVPITTARAYSRVAAPYFLRLGEAIYGVEDDPISSAGMIVSQGKIIHAEVQKHMDHYQKE